MCDITYKSHPLGWLNLWPIIPLQNQALTTVKWGTDYLINAHINETTYVGQLGISGIGDNDDIDFAY